MTNPTTDLPMLDDEAITEIRTKSAKYKQLANRAATPADADVVRWFAKNVHALCATVRALRGQYESAVYDFAAEINAVRGQLEQVTKERDDLRSRIEQYNYMSMFSDTHVGED